MLHGQLRAVVAGTHGHPRVIGDRAHVVRVHAGHHEGYDAERAPRRPDELHARQRRQALARVARQRLIVSRHSLETGRAGFDAPEPHVVEARQRSRPPAYIDASTDKFEARYVELPQASQIPVICQISLVVEYYSR